jgi:predicted anti-sigma-YlaC factor YlaD
MTHHLTSEQISESILGEPDPRIAEHLENCPACRAELGNFRQALGEFRGAVRCWSENQAQAALAVSAPPSESRSWIASHQLALALLLAAVCILTSILWHPGPNALSNDAVLLNQVDAQVSRSVPSSMEPLTKLVVQE